MNERESTQSSQPCAPATSSQGGTCRLADLMKKDVFPLLLGGLSAPSARGSHSLRSCRVSSTVGVGGGHWEHSFRLEEGWIIPLGGSVILG